MTRPPSFFSYPSGARPAKSAQSSRGITDFLRSNDKMAMLFPAVARLAAIQRDCAKILPAIFETCSVLSFESGQLVLSAPNAAFVAKLKQQLPKLQENLLKLGWQVNAIRLKVQVRKIAQTSRPVKQLVLPGAALHALSSLKETLPDSPQNQSLKSALETLIHRHIRR